MPSIRYSEALGWAAELHRHHPRTLLPWERLAPIARALAVSVLVWEDGGDEDQAIAALLSEAATIAAQSHRAVGDRYGERVADLVVAARTFAHPPHDDKGFPEASLWVTSCRSRLRALQNLSATNLRVLTAQLAQDADECWQACRAQPDLWSRRPGGLEGSAWYWLRQQQLLRRLLPGSLSLERLGEVLQRVLASPIYAERVPVGLTPAVWAARFDDRCQLAEAFPDLPSASTHDPSLRSFTRRDCWPARR